MSVTISEIKIKNKIKLSDAVAVVENIKYPHFESDTDKKLCDKMNLFYSSVAEKYSRFSRGKLIQKIKLKKGRIKLPVTLSMNYMVALCDENVVSVVLDLTFCEDKNIKTRRFSQMWSAKKGDLVSISEIFRTDRKSVKTIYSHVLAIAENNADNTAFGYFDDYKKRLAKNFRIDCCFAVPNGLCFFVNAGILSLLKYGVNSFVVPYEELSDVLKWDFSEKSERKSSQNADIVNNV